MHEALPSPLELAVVKIFDMNLLLDVEVHGKQRTIIFQVILRKLPRIER